MEIPGTPTALGHNQRTALGRKWKLTSEKAETAAMYDPIIPPRCAYQKFLSAGGESVSDQNSSDDDLYDS